MAYISFQPSDFFNSLLWTGTGATNARTGLGFQPDLTWIKCRDSAFDHVVQDAVRGATYQLNTNNNAGQTNRTDEVTSFDADGFTLGSDGTEGVVNNSGDTYIGWNWKAGTTTGIDTTGSTITPTAYSFNQTSGFSIVQYNGNDTAGAKIPHGLGVAPDFVIVKTLGDANAWVCQHEALGPTYYQYIDTTAAATTGTTKFNDTAPDAVNVTVGSGGNTNGSGGDSPLIMYSFASKKGFSKVGVYNGNTETTTGAPFIYTGFRPAFVIIKAQFQTTNWIISDSKRLGYNVDNNPLYTDVNVAAGTANNLDLLSNGFKIRTGSGSGSVNEINTNGGYYNYIAFAEFPIVSSNSKAGTAR